VLGVIVRLSPAEMINEGLHQGASDSMAPTSHRYANRSVARLAAAADAFSD
jgi:hypothetical protein